MCNPCVPDPNYSPPPQHGQASAFPPFSPTTPSPHLAPSNAPPRGPRPSHRSTQSANDSARTVGHAQGLRSRDVFTDRRTSYHGASRVADLWPPAQTPPHGYAQPPAYDSRSRPHSRSVLISNYPPTSNDFSGHSMPGSRRGFFAHGPPAPSQLPQPPPTPRRQIAEEDECPVCGDELPAKGLDGDETARTQHVEECIALHSGSPPPAATTPADVSSTSLPSQRTRGMSSATGNGEGSSNRMSMMARGMVPYVATEKDCVDEEGAEAECVICFEEFEAGDKMARLVCWCKFHEVSSYHVTLSQRLTRRSLASKSGGIRRAEARAQRINCSTRPSVQSTRPSICILAVASYRTLFGALRTEDSHLLMMGFCLLPASWIYPLPLFFGIHHASYRRGCDMVRVAGIAWFTLVV